MRCSVFIAASLEGYIARPDGALDWLEAPGAAIENEKKVVVLSGRTAVVPERLRDQAEARALGPDELAKQLQEEGFRHAYVDGGKTIQGFLEAGLIRELTLTWIPVLLGGGIPLFGPLSRDVQLRR